VQPRLDSEYHVFGRKGRQGGVELCHNQPVSSGRSAPPGQVCTEPDGRLPAVCHELANEGHGRTDALQRVGQDGTRPP